jgi:DNA-binding NarL/FixJ family response regulator
VAARGAGAAENAGCFSPGNESIGPRSDDGGISAVKVLVVDDHAVIREALFGVLKELKGHATVLEASSCDQAMRVITAHPDLDLVLLDLNLPDRDGFSVLAELKDRCPAMSVVVLSDQLDRESVVRALDLGALGFIPKSGQREMMISALQLAFAGGIYVPPEILARDKPPPPEPGETGRRAGRPRVAPLHLRGPIVRRR